jgi:hypothetical protein
VAGVSNVAQRGVENLSELMPYYAKLRHSVARILAHMDRTGVTEDQQNELSALVLSKMLELFRDPVKSPGKVLPWPKTREPKPGPF